MSFESSSFSLILFFSISVSNEWSVISMNHFLSSLNVISFCTWLRYTSILFYFITNQQTRQHNKEANVVNIWTSHSSEHLLLLLKNEYSFFYFQWIYRLSSFYFFACLHTWLPLNRCSEKVYEFVCVCKTCSWIGIHIHIQMRQVWMDRLTASFKLVLYHHYHNSSFCRT